MLSFLICPLKMVVRGVLAGVPGAEQVGLAEGHVQFTQPMARAILAAVVLLFHQDEQLGYAQRMEPYLFLKIRERLKQTNGGYAALVFKKIAHGIVMKRLSCKCGVSAARRWCLLYSPCTLT